ncbi:MAG: ribonuclease P protein component [Bacillota bacterium]
MLPKAKRLTRASFAPLAAGKRAVSAHFSITWLPSDEGRCAAVVSKKVAKKAVDRHTLKRRIIDAITPHAVQGRSFVVYARAGSPSLPYRILKQELDTLFSSLPKV